MTNLYRVTYLYSSTATESTNPRILIVAKILVGVCQLLPEEECEGFCLSNQTNSKGERVDTFTNEQKVQLA